MWNSNYQISTMDLVGMSSFPMGVTVTAIVGQVVYNLVHGIDATYLVMGLREKWQVYGGLVLGVASVLLMLFMLRQRGYSRRRRIIWYLLAFFVGP